MLSDTSIIILNTTPEELLDRLLWLTQKTFWPSKAKQGVVEYSIEPSGPDKQGVWRIEVHEYRHRMSDLWVSTVLISRTQQDKARLSHQSTDHAFLDDLKAYVLHAYEPVTPQPETTAQDTAPEAKKQCTATERRSLPGRPRGVTPKVARLMGNIEIIQFDDPLLKKPKETALALIDKEISTDDEKVKHALKKLNKERESIQ